MYTQREASRRCCGQPDPTVRRDRRFAVRILKAPFTKRVNPRPGLRPDAAFHILEDAADEVAREAVPLGIDRHARLLESHQTAIGPNPQTVVDAPRNGRHPRARQAVGRCVALEAARGSMRNKPSFDVPTHIRPSSSANSDSTRSFGKPVVGTELGHAVGVDAIEAAAHGRHPERSIWRAGPAC